MRKKAQPRIKTVCIFCSEDFLSVSSANKKFCGKKCYGLSRRGVKFSKEHREKMSKSALGRNNYWCEKTKTEVVCPCGETKLFTPGQMREGHGKYCSRDCYYKHRKPQGFAVKEKREELKKKKVWAKTEDQKKKISESRIKNKLARGDRNLNWQGGKTKLSNGIRNIYLYKKWRKDVYTRDGFACVECGQIGTGRNLEADHIEPLSLLIKRFKITTVEDAIETNKLWNTENGRTLCVDCHKKTDSYGWKATNNYLRKEK